MHVKAKNVATAGLLVAFTVIMMILSTVIESNSLFLIAAASFCVGVAIREWGLSLGFAFFVAAVVLNFIVAPNKFHCFTFAGMGVYIWVEEWLYRRLADKENCNHRTLWLWVGKYVIFNLMYVPVLFGFPKLLFKGKINGIAAVFFLLGGQAALLVYDVAYRYFQSKIWGRLRVRLLKK